jgi:hypothetical protein
MIYAIALAAGLVAVFVALKIWASSRSKPKAPRPVTSGMVYQTSASDIDRYVVGAEDWWQHLRPMPLFWVAAFGTAILVGLDYFFGYQKAGWAGLAVIGSLMAIADIAIPFIALEGDVKGQRSAANWFLLCLFTFFTIVVVIGSTAEISTTSGAKSDVAQMGFEDSTKLLKQKQNERDSIKIDRGAEALNDLAKSTEEAAEREGGRTKCGTKCEALKGEAKDYRARAAEAARKEKLTGEIEAIKLKLQGGGTGAQEVRLDSDPMATNIEWLTAGVVTRDATRRGGLTVLGVTLVITLTVLWVVIGGNLKDEIEWELSHRGEIADATRANMGLPPKYTAPAAPTALLAPPQEPTPPDGLTVNISAEDMRKRYANDANLLETDSLFGTLLMKGEGASVSIADLYRAYQVASLMAGHNRFMTQVVMAQKLFVIAQNRDDVRVTADGIIQGWVLKPADSRKLESANAS